MSANIAKIAKVTRCMPVDLTKKKIDTIGHWCVLRSKNTPYKYRKNNRYNKMHDFGKEEAKRDPEMPANIAKVTRIFHAS